MKKIYEGKTKDVFELANETIHLMLFKDDVTGTEEGIDPGANQVIGRLEDKGFSSLKITEHFFTLLKEHDVPTHFIEANLQERTMKVYKAENFGFEVICRLFAYGSFIRRYPHLVENMHPLNYLVEITIKDDEVGDPLINDEALCMLKVLDESELESVKKITKSAASVIEKELKYKGLDLIDFKIEFGKINGEIAIIDEISGDGMRVMKDGKIINQIDLNNYLFDEE